MLTAATLALAACSETPPEDAAAQPVEVLVMKVQPQDVEVTDELPGRVVAFRTAEIRPQVGGIIQRRFFEQGAFVQAGQPLFQINPAPYRADANSAAASLARARASLHLASTQAGRLKPLVAADAISRQSYDNAVAQRAQAAAEVAQAGSELARRRLDVGFARVTSPISGQIGATLVTEGALVAAQDSNPLAVVQQIDKVYVDVRQPAERFEALLQARGSGKAPDANSVEILTSSGISYPVRGRILFSGVTVEPGTGNAVVRVEVNNPQHRLLPGMFVRARLPRMTAPAAITVPQEAVTRDAKGVATVAVVDSQGRVRDRQVNVGEIYNGRYILLSGIRAGETIIVVGRDRVQTGVPVNPRPWQPAKR
ncbi:efflux RND transporter periplasmic adaptor subunit [Sphingosinicella sp. BN140058]|uniref:efflux RND transporter periplasmic adaptor subunit n=1 Tax=Sphingosinicella sp. BN140058 TaxID=1892855 RepID=UPI001FB0C467|nr:efflux RND transporter periplasmic adaptor subunit [Sphingosinicella sp. BN140058]